jgi:hypothetical protein
MMDKQNGLGIGGLPLLAADAEFARVFNVGIVEIMRDSIARAIEP